MLTGHTFAQSPALDASIQKIPKKPIKPLTVCEIFRNPGKYVGRHLAILGRAVSSEDIFSGIFLSEENCRNTMRSGDFVWPYEIWLDPCALCFPVTNEKMRLNEAVLNSKLSRIRRSTPLLTRRKKKFEDYRDRDLPDEFHDVKDSWEIAYGRLDAVPNFVPQGSRQITPPVVFGFGRPPMAPLRLRLILDPRFIEDKP